MTINDEKIKPQRLADIFEKKENLKLKIKASEKRIDEKINSLIADGFITDELNIDKINKENAKTYVKPINDDHPDIFSEIDLSDDDALDQAVRYSRPNLAFSQETDPFKAPLSLDLEDDEEIPTISKVLGRPQDTDKRSDDLNFEELLTQETDQKIPELKLEMRSSLEDETQPSLKTIIKEPIIEDPIKTSISKEKIKPIKPRSPAKETKLNPIMNSTPNTRDMILPSFLFLLGIIACGVFLVGFSTNFSFIDYSVLFILLTCLIFTIALPYLVSLVFMVLITLAYGILIIVSTLYFEMPFNAYQFAWLLIIPLILFGSTLLIKRIRELYYFKKELEGQINSYDTMEKGFGLTNEKTYYKDLKNAMDRASENEIILVVEMISISHLETLRSINGPRLWDEILYKTLKIIKKHSYSTHLIYVLEGNVFSIIMENTSMKNQLMINKSIRGDFDALINSYEVVDVPVDLKIASIPYSREINNPFDYRALGFRHLEH